MITTALKSRALWLALIVSIVYVGCGQSKQGNLNDTGENDGSSLGGGSGDLGKILGAGMNGQNSPNADANALKNKGTSTEDDIAQLGDVLDGFHASSAAGNAALQEGAAALDKYVTILQQLSQADTAQEVKNLTAQLEQAKKDLADAATKAAQANENGIATALADVATRENVYLLANSAVGRFAYFKDAADLAGAISMGYGIVGVAFQTYKTADGRTDPKELWECFYSRGDKEVGTFFLNQDSGCANTGALPFRMLGYISGQQDRYATQPLTRTFRLDLKDSYTTNSQIWVDAANRLGYGYNTPLGFTP